MVYSGMLDAYCWLLCTVYCGLAEYWPGGNCKVLDEHWPNIGARVVYCSVFSGLLLTMYCVGLAARYCEVLSVNLGLYCSAVVL